MPALQIAGVLCLVAAVAILSLRARDGTPLPAAQG